MKMYICLAFSAGILLNGCSGKKSDNPLLNEFTTPFGVPPFEQIKTEHYLPAILEGIEQGRKEIAQIATNSETPTFENTIVAFDRAGTLMKRVMPVFSNLNEANTNPEMQKIEEEVTPILTRYRDDIYLNQDLFNRVKYINDLKDKLGLNPEQKKLLDNVYKAFVRSGAMLGEEDKKKLRAINEELSMLALKFGNNLLSENKSFKLVLDNEEQLEGLPEGVIAAAAEEAKNDSMPGKWVFTLDKPSMIPFLQFSPKRELREKIYMGYGNRANFDNETDNKAVISKMVQLRLQRAQLLGYKSHADFIISENMAKTPDKVFELLNKLWDAALPVAKREAADMQKMIDQEGDKFTLASWDWWYYSEKVRKQKFNLDESMMRPYFKLDNVRDGIFMVSNKLYGITFTALPDVPKYQEDVQVFEVKEADGSHLGILYLDFFPRAGKRGGAWCTGFRDQFKDKDGKRVNPIVSIVCNFTPPSGDEPSLLSADEVETFFHEFGHGLHGLFADYTYEGTGNVPRDFVELPSQIMEHWAFEPEVLKDYAKHYKTGEVIPQELVSKMTASGKFNQGFATVEYLAASILDMDYHVLTDATPVQVPAFEKASMDRIGLIPEILPRYRSTYFSHIFSSGVGGYSAGYYNYIWAEVLDCDAYQAFKEKGNIFDQETAKAFRYKVLARGGIDEGMDMYKAFRGKEPAIDALLEKRGLK
jgi:peptidyl-dipeptidase Dcp